MITSYSKEDIYKYIKIYEEEAQANLTLYTSGKDDSALQRYNHLMNHVRKLRETLRTK